MKITRAEFQTSAARLEQCPPPVLPEFAFIGRSNVGKSSMINMLTGRKALAKVSVTPGKTRLINFFEINQRWRLVDLPGYGYAKVSKQQRADFSDAVENYISERPNLFFVFVLIDGRHTPHAIDLDFVSWLDGTGVPYGLLFTKADKVGAVTLGENVAHFMKASAEAGLSRVPRYAVTSSAKGKGRVEILTWIDEHLDQGGV